MEFAPKTVLSLLDLSPASAQVLTWTRLMAEKFGSEVKVLHVIWPPVPHAVTEEESNQLLEEYEQRRQELGRSVRAQVGDALGTAVRYSVGIGVGHPVKVVLDTIAQMKPELIVLGSHGHDGMARSLMGSVAENVVRESAYPTLVVKGSEPTAGQTKLKNLLCPVDLSHLAAQSLEVSASIARGFDAVLDVLRVVPEGGDVEGEIEALREWDREVVGKRCPVSENVHVGDTAEQIIKFARHHASQLIVVAAEPRKFLEYTVLGRTVERAVRHGPCSVLLLRLEPRSN
jgi:nucleotide-binding universal stress UspA family protein